MIYILSFSFLCFHFQSGSDPESLQIVESSVASLDGAVLSVDSIVSTSGPWSCGRFKSCPSIQDKLGISGDVGKISLAAILSTTTVLVHYFQPQAQKRCRSVQGSLTLCHGKNSILIIFYSCFLFVSIFLTHSPNINYFNAKWQKT